MKEYMNRWEKPVVNKPFYGKDLNDGFILFSVEHRHLNKDKNIALSKHLESVFVEEGIEFEKLTEDYHTWQRNVYKVSGNNQELITELMKDVFNVDMYILAKDKRVYLHYKNGGVEGVKGQWALVSDKVLPVCYMSENGLRWGFV